MKKILGMTFGGLQHKILNLVLTFLLLMVAVFGAISFYQSKTLSKTVNQAREKQQEAIRDVSEETMNGVVNKTLSKTTALQAYIADEMFVGLKNSVETMQSLAKDTFDKKDSFQKREVYAPDASNEGKLALQVLWEEGVDYKKSEYLGIAANMGEAMIALLKSTENINTCYFGLSDGTHICVDEHSANKFDNLGKVINFPVRERPWYKAAVEKGEICFTGVITDAYTGEVCVTCAAPVYSNVKLIGVVGADLFLDSMADYVNKSEADGGFVCVVNNDGKIVFSPEKSGTLKVETDDKAADLRKGENKDLGELITASYKEQTEPKLIKIDDKEYFVLGSPMKTIGWTVLSFIDKDITQQPTQAMLSEYDKINNEATSEFEYSSTKSKQTSLVMILVILVLGSVAALWLAGRIVKPMTAMTEDLIEGGKTGKAFEMKDIYNTKDEIQVFAETINDLSQKANKYIHDITEINKEKDKNEKFYYKFVPEKFRELLGKEKFTDLALGDAKSREFAVLFCDIRSFSINSEMMTAKENFEFVNVIYGIAGPIIRKYGGFVDKYIGDAVMALFETADSAVNAGIELYRSIVLDPSTAKKLKVSEINVGIGIHMGMARIGIVGEEERLAGTVISNTVNISSRLESLTKKYHTAMLITKDTLDRMTSPDTLTTRYVGMIRMEGVNEVKSVYEVLDCLDEEQKELRKGTSVEFREAIRLFHLGKRKQSMEYLKKLVDENKADHVTRLYLDYISSLSEDDKSNVFIFDKK